MKCLDLEREKLILKDAETIAIRELAKKYNRSVSSMGQFLQRRRIKAPLADTRRMISTLNENFFSNYNELSCYWAGFIAADGCIYKNKLSIKLSINDVNHLKTFAKQIGGYEVKIYDKECSLTINSPQIVNDLKNNFNIIPRKSLTMIYPHQIKLHNHFIRGYFDGDGCIFNASTKRTKFTSKPRYTILGTKDMLDNIKNYFDKTSKYTSKQRRNIYYISFYNNASEFYSFMYNHATIYLNRKKLKAEKLISAFNLFKFQ
jgi:intein/homing endonuclease